VLLRVARGLGVVVGVGGFRFAFGAGERYRPIGSRRPQSAAMGSVPDVRKKPDELSC